MNWTKEQQQAISTWGQNLLVAAAAGSGKTAVLVERIIQLVIGEQADLDQLLIVTFTKAAAIQMRERLGQALDQAIQNNPQNSRLPLQKPLLLQASICTLHSFCLDLVRQYFYYLDLDPAFRIAEENEVALFRQEVLEDLLEDCYEQAEAGFIQLADVWGGERNDQPLMELIEQIYDFVKTDPQQLAWLEQKLAQFKQDSQTPLDQLSWLTELKQEILLKVQEARRLLHTAQKLSQSSSDLAGYSLILEQEVEMLLELEKTTAWEDWEQGLRQLKFARLPRKPKNASAEYGEQIQALRNQAKKLLAEIKGDFFSQTAAEHQAALGKALPLLETLTGLVKKFNKGFQEAKKNRNVLDFNDLEHYALQILEQEELRPFFKEVLVDEYQDINPLQEQILKLASQSSHLFMVGDMKQSIYRFRQADPYLFQNKYAAYLEPDSSEGEGIKIDLNANFRSRPEVIAAVNDLFGRLMQKDCGEITYDQQAALKYGAAYPDPRPEAVEWHLIEKKPQDGIEGNEDLEIETDAIRAEAIVVAERIAQLFQEGLLIYENGDYRPLEYRDLVILMRSVSNWAEIFLEELSKRNLPVYADQVGGYYDTVEIEIILALLQIIDNPRQDIPLAAVWRSAIGGMSVDDLAEIGLMEGGKGFYEKGQLYQSEGSKEEIKSKLRELETNLAEWRKLAGQTSLTKLLGRIYQETGFYDYVGALPNGRQRQANLRLLSERAAQYQNSNFRGLMGFLGFINRLKENRRQISLARTLSEGEQVIRLMSIHKSKGLEFPVVILSGLGRKFNLRDLNRPLLLHRQMGLGADCVEIAERYKYPTLAKLALKNRLHKELLAEEMRILYVALTRAKEKLILTGSVPKLADKLKSWQEEGQGAVILVPQLLQKATSALEWIGLALGGHPDITGQGMLGNYFTSSWQFITHPYALNQAENPPHPLYQEWQDKLKTAEIVPEIERRLSWIPNWEAAELPVKVSVSELKEQLEEPYPELYPAAEWEQEFRQLNLVQPTSKELSPAHKGTILHRVLQQINLKDLSNLQQQVQQMVEQEILTDLEAQSVDLSLIENFLQSPLGQRMAAAPDLRRETAFSLYLPISEVLAEVKLAENILVQGAIDCFWREAEGLVILDFKTGYRQAPKEAAYRQQLQLYGRALENITGCPIKEKYIYYLAAGQAIQVD